MSEQKYYCVCNDDSRHETLTKEQILAAIAQAMETGKIGECDTGFITKVKEKNSGNYVTFWVGTQAEYNAIATKAANCMYIITDDTTNDDLLKTIEQMKKSAEEAATAAAAAAASSSLRRMYDKNFATNETVTEDNPYCRQVFTGTALPKLFAITIEATGDIGFDTGSIYDCVGGGLHTVFIDWYSPEGYYNITPFWRGDKYETVFLTYGTDENNAAYFMIERYYEAFHIVRVVGYA